MRLDYLAQFQRDDFGGLARIDRQYMQWLEIAVEDVAIVVARAVSPPRIIALSLHLEQILGHLQEREFLVLGQPAVASLLLALLNWIDALGDELAGSPSSNPCSSERHRGVFAQSMIAFTLLAEPAAAIEQPP